MAEGNSMTKTVKDFVWMYDGKAIDYDHAYSVQCVDGFKEFCSWAKIPVKATPNNYADGYWYYRLKLGYVEHFTFITGHKNYKNGDWVIWPQGSKSHPKSHIAMYYNGYEFGQNQGVNPGFTLKKTDFSDSLGALRWNGFKQIPELPTAYLKYGSKNAPQVKKLQIAMNYVTGSQLKVDGIFGRKTENVFMMWQKKHGKNPPDGKGALKVNGHYGDRSRSVLKEELK